MYLNAHIKILALHLQSLGARFRVKSFYYLGGAEENMYMKLDLILYLSFYRHIE